MGMPLIIQSMDVDFPIWDETTTKRVKAIKGTGNHAERLINLSPADDFFANNWRAIASSSGIIISSKNASKNGCGSTILAASSPMNNHKYKGSNSIWVMKRMGVEISIAFSLPRPSAVNTWCK